MKRNQILSLALALVLSTSACPVFAAETASTSPSATTTEDSTAEEPQAALPERLLAYGKITDLNQQDGTLTSITAQSVQGETIVYTVDESTIFFDSGKGIAMDATDLNVGDGVYFYHNPAMTASLPPRTYAQAVVGNMPMDVACAHLHTVESLTDTDTGRLLVTDQGGLQISLPADTTYTYLDGSAAAASDLQANDRIFTWYEAVQESYPARTSANRVVILPAEETVTPWAVSYGKSELKEQNGTLYVPLRTTAEELQLSLLWDSDTRTATLQSDARSMDFTEGEDLYLSTSTLPGAVGMTAPLTLGAAPFIDATGTMYVPADAFTALVGLQVEETADQITISAQPKS